MDITGPGDARRHLSREERHVHAPRARDVERRRGVLCDIVGAVAEIAAGLQWERLACPNLQPTAPRSTPRSRLAEGGCADRRLAAMRTPIASIDGRARPARASLSPWSRPVLGSGPSSASVTRSRAGRVGDATPGPRIRV